MRDWVKSWDSSYLIRLKETYIDGGRHALDEEIQTTINTEINSNVDWTSGTGRNAVRFYQYSLLSDIT